MSFYSRSFSKESFSPDAFRFIDALAENLKVFLYGAIITETDVLGAAPSISSLSGDSGQTQRMKGKTIPR